MTPSATMTIPKALLTRMLALLVNAGARNVTHYESETMTVKLSRRHRPDRRNKREEFVLTIGAPNYMERVFIRIAKRAKEKFPVRRLQLRFYPKGRK